MQQRMIESIDNSEPTKLISHAGLVTRCSKKKKKKVVQTQETRKVPR